MTNPLVSVCMITYGHEKYIREAINSILMQRTNFYFELVISNDCSPDNTDLIVKDIIKKHPQAEKINYILQPKNIGMMPNFIDAIKKCNGEYIAFCEGDDFWLDENKLQKQVDLLDSNEEISGVATGYHNVNAEGAFLNLSNTLPHNINLIETKHLLQKNLIATCTVLLRNKFIKAEKDFDFIRHQMLGDLSVWLLSSLNGPIYFLPDTTAAYRNGVGIASTFNQLKYARLSMAIREEFLNQYSQNFKNYFYYFSALAFYVNKYSQILAKNSLKFSAFIQYLRCILMIPFMWLNRSPLQRVNIKSLTKTIKLIIS